MSLPDDLDALARSVIDANRYMTLGTTEPDHRPRVSPVYFTHAAYRRFYWVSSPSARHSGNLTERPAVAIVIFDSTAEIGAGRAVYVDANALMIPEEELPRRCAEAFTGGGPDAVAFAPEELSGDADLRLYCAKATGFELHVPGRDPRYGSGVDTRRPVSP
jgi:pyridoxamine 5'-phosphate oxidase-like protein